MILYGFRPALFRVAPRLGEESVPRLDPHLAQRRGPQLDPGSRGDAAAAAGP
ncbi:hypothetical protein ACGFIV_22035 [Sphaerisporangium sp. NPDC049003]|uniref:hypothetical protein n=1 Tax=Sphaerisporangium sp. NPDC049003 TaxID=3364517 RepID=UPI003713CCEB